jgi:hypothetical protein
MNIIWKEEDKELSKYFKKTLERQVLVMKATNNMVVYFVSLGNDLATATNYVEQLSTEISSHIRTYELGNTQPLKDAINGSALGFMDAAAKTEAINQLTYTPS